MAQDRRRIAQVSLDHGDAAHTLSLFLLLLLLGWMLQVMFVLGRARGDVLAVRVVEGSCPRSDPIVYGLLSEVEASAAGDAT